MYIIKADGVVIYNPASDDSARKVLEPRAKFKLNKAGSLEFAMLPDNVMYGRLQRMKSVVTLEQDGKIIFQGRVLDTVTDINRHINVYCEGALGYLMDSAVRPYTYEGGATGLFYQLVVQHNAQVDGYKQFSVGSVTAAGGEMLEEYDSDSCANTLNEIQQMLIDPYGGYLRVRHSGSTNYLDYIDAYGTSSSQTLEYGVNMVAMEDAYELGNIYSILVPLGAYYTEEDKKEEEEGGEEEPATVAEGEETEGETPDEEVDETIGEDGLKKKLKIAGVVTIEKVNGGSDYLIDSDMLSKYGRVVKAHRWENVDDPQELMNKGYEMLERNKDARSIKLRAVDLHVINASVDTIELGDSVRLVSNPHGLSLTDICSAIDLDIEYPEYTEYTFGIAQDTLTEQNASASRRASYQSSSFLRWLTETDTSLNIAVQNVDLINGKLTQVGIDVDALKGAVTLWAQRIEGLDTQMAELMVKYDEIVATVENNSGQISQLRLDVDSITAQVEDATGKLSQLRIDVDSITARVQNNEGDISQLKIDIDSITAKVEDAEGKIAALELSLTDLEAKVVLKAQYDEDKNAMLTLISNAEESIATLAAEHGDRLAALELYTSDLESRVLLKAEYEENRKADLQLIANAEESIAKLEADHDGRIASLELKTNDLESSVLLKAEYEENREADLQLISNAQESVATLETKYDGQIASLTLRADEQGSLISAKADRIDLEGFVTMDEFEALEGKIADLEAGLGTVTVLNANTVNTTDINATFGSFSSLSFGGSTVSKRSITMGSISTAGTALSAGGALDLSHSHAVSVGGDGTITLGEVSSTGGSFNMADTKFYKDGVSAARIDGANSVTLTVSGWQSGGRNTVTASNGKSETITLPTFSTSGGDTWSGNKTTVYFHTGTVSGPLASKEVDATSIVQAGTQGGFNVGYEMAIVGALIELDGTTVKVYSPDGGIAGPTLDISDELDASYNDGYADATPTGVDRTATYNSADNTYSLSIKVKSADGSSRDFTAVALNAAAAYNAGYKAAKDSATLTCEGVNAIVTFGDGTTKTLDLSEYVTVTGGIRSITNTAQNYYMAQGYANAYINGVDVDYTTFSKAQSFG